MKRTIDPQPIIKELSDRCLIAKGVECSVLGELIDMLKAAPGVYNAPQWISVTERLPEDDSDVLAYLRIGEEGRIYPANYAKGVWWDCIFNTPATKTTTHWMPLPEPPKEGK